MATENTNLSACDPCAGNPDDATNSLSTETAGVPDAAAPACAPDAGASSDEARPAGELLPREEGTGDSPAISSVSGQADAGCAETASEAVASDVAVPGAVETAADAPQEPAALSAADAPDTPSDSTEEEQPRQQVDFADEEAELAARQAGLDLGEETPEEAGEPATDDGDYAGRTKEELVDLFAALLAEKPVQTLRRDAEAIKIAFYKLHRADGEALRRRFAEQNGEDAVFVPVPDASEARLKDLFREYRRRRDEFIAGLDAVKEANLKVKQQLIDELRELVDSDETVGHTFNRFRELQQRWRETGPVPQQYVKDLWETYNLHVENFYNFIKINKELRDLDLRRNYEQKTALCESAEALAAEPSVIEAFRKLQKLHDEWRETGPVANEYKEALWERFKEASSRVNKRHQAYFEEIKAEQQRNLELKAELCSRAEELLAQPMTTRKEWNRASDRLLEVQKVWKTIGFAPKKDNNRIYERFRGACDRFFEAKRAYYAGLKSEMEHNLALKNEICLAAEALARSEEWKKTTDELIALQARWKEVGPVPRRHSDQIWKRFRAACDSFFERKNKHFSAVDGQYEENLRLKEALLEEMEAADAASVGFEAIRDFQRRWTEIGFVPIKRKEAMQKRYKAAVDRLFEALRGSERDRSMNRFKEKVSTLRSTGDKRLRTERDRLYGKVRQLEQEIALLENNIGFFARSKNADALVADVRQKIERAKAEMQAAIEKVRLIDRGEQ